MAEVEIMLVGDWARTVVEWKDALDGLQVQIGPALGRLETRISAGHFIKGLLSGAERKTGWMLAEEAGLERPCPSSEHLAQLAA
jgi:hypothetical protein